MKKILKNSLLLFFMLCLIITTSSCEKKQEQQLEGLEAVLSNLEDNSYYILHSDNTVDKLVTYPSTMSGDTTYPQNDHVIWMYEDGLASVPTMYAGDKLIYHSYSEISESFFFERFEDMDYSIGICGLGISSTGRYTISTEEGNAYIYPGGDTSDILSFENDYVIIEDIGSTPIRAVYDESEQRYFYDDKILSRVGSIVGLEKDQIYNTNIYSGTLRYNYDFKADKKIFGGMETFQTDNYSFENDRIIVVGFPETARTGYYKINNAGFFRYVNGDHFDENTNFNIKNTTETLSNTYQFYSIYSDEDTENENSNNMDTEIKSPDEADHTFVVTAPGTYKVSVSITMDESLYSDEDFAATSAYVVNPSQTKKWYLDGDEKLLEGTLNLDETGDYSIFYTNTDNRDISAEVTKIEG